MQATLAIPARFKGAGLHSGAPARLTIHPAPAGHGIVFRRTDLDTGAGGALIPARWDRVVPRSAARPPATLQDPRALFPVVLDPASVPGA